MTFVHVSCFPTAATSLSNFSTCARIELMCGASSSSVNVLMVVRVRLPTAVPLDARNNEIGWHFVVAEDVVNWVAHVVDVYLLIYLITSAVDDNGSFTAFILFYYFIILFILLASLLPMG